MKDPGFFDVFRRHLAMAMAWGIVFLAVFAVSAVGIKQEVKEAIQYVVLNVESVRPPCKMPLYHHPFHMGMEHKVTAPENK